MTSQEIIDKLTELDIPTSVAQDQNNDPYTLLEKINYILSKLEDIDKNEGTEVKVGGIYQKTLDFVDDPQDQITNLTDAVALNVEGIAHMNEIKQDKLSQTDLDNIAGLNQLQDKLDAKASKTEVNSLSMCPTYNYQDYLIDKTVTGSTSFTIEANGWINILIVYDTQKYPNAHFKAIKNVAQSYKTFIPMPPHFTDTTTGFCSVYFPAQKGDTLEISTEADNTEFSIARVRLFYMKEV